MAIDTSGINLDAIIEQETHVRLGKAVGTGIKRTRKGPCPWCGGTDRFAVLVNDEPQHFYCGIHGSGCGAHGDVIAFMQRWYKIGFYDACQRLGLGPGTEYKASARSATVNSPVVAPCQAWQERASVYAQRAQRFLWSTSGTAALDYLHWRGLTDETIRAAQLGYIPFADADKGYFYREKNDQWGLPGDEDKSYVYLYEGILIPWIVDGALWKLNVRRLNGLKVDSAKYLEIKGSADPLYNVDSLLAERPAVLVESEIDALSGQQSTTRATWLASGSAGRARRDKWLAQLCLADIVLVAYDDDNPDTSGKRAGDSGAQFWLDTLPHAVRWLPWQHDLNDMLTEGKDIQAWLSIGVEAAALTLAPVPVAANKAQERMVIHEVTYRPDVCSDCGSRSVRWILGSCGPYYCEKCFRLLKPQGVWS